MNGLNSLKHWIDQLESNTFFKNLVIDDFLDRRDSNAFDTRWISDSNKLNNINFSTEDLAYIAQLREITFKFIDQITMNTELAAYLSDDIELIAKSIITEQKNSWAIQQLWKCYLQGTDPTLYR